MTKKKFIEYITPILEEHLFEIDIRTEPYKRNKWVAGQIDHIRRRLIIYPHANTSTWAHEFSHFLQWRDCRYFFERGVSAINLLENKTITSSGDILKCVRDLVRLEWDCMQREGKIMSKMNLQGDWGRQSQKYNSYLWSFYFGAPKFGSTFYFPKSIANLSHYLNPKNLTDGLRERAGWINTSPLDLYKRDREPVEKLW